MSIGRLDNHTVRVIVGGKEVGGWISYEISQSMLRPADAFTMTRAFDRAAWDLLRPDQPIRVLIDDVAVLSGFIDDSDKPASDDVITITGRDRVGRLVQESAPGVSYKGLRERDLIAKLASPWFSTVKLDNARNRRVLRGKGKKAPSGPEPIRLDTQAGTQIEPGQMRWTVIEELLRQTGHLCWSSGDGTELVVGVPNYDQAIQWKLFHPGERSQRGREGNALAFGVKRSTGDRYSKVVVVGSGAGTDANYGAAVAARYGEAKENSATFDGEGISFSAPKRLVLVEDVQSRKEASEIARREMARRTGEANRLSVRMPLHGQRVAGPYLTLFALDTLAFAEDEVTGLRGAYLVTDLTFAGARDTGATTTLGLVAKGTELFL